MRKDLLVNGEIYHVFNRSIADFVIFNNEKEFERIAELMKYYQVENDIKFSAFLELRNVQNEGFNNTFDIISKDKDKLVQIIAYCIMPTHIHFILKQMSENGISDYMRKVLDSYTRYFNTCHKRKGPLWEGKFKNVLIISDDQLLHLTRYIHLNPVTAFLIEKPDNWVWSSYTEYLWEGKRASSLCHFDDILEIKPSFYRKFVIDRVSYQRELGKIKKLIMD